MIEWYRKKPVKIQAWHLDKSHTDALEAAKWCGGSVSSDSNPDGKDMWHFVSIPTLEGTMLASPGDYIIKGVKGEFYPCKPDIFEATYEPVMNQPQGSVY